MKKLQRCNPVYISEHCVVLLYKDTKICGNIQPICTKTSYSETSISQPLQQAQLAQAHNHDNSQHNCLKGHHHHKPQQPKQQTQSTQPPQTRENKNKKNIQTPHNHDNRKHNPHKPHSLKIHHKLHKQHNQHKHQTSQPQQPT